MKEDFVTYEQALVLKKLEFDWKLHYYYYGKDLLYCSYIDNYNMSKQLVSAPTLAEAQKWLREKKNLYIFIYNEIVTEGKGKFYWCVDNEKGFLVNDNLSSDAIFNTYENALSAGITECLKLLEE